MPEQLLHAVPVNVEGFRKIRIHYNLMAAEQELMALRRMYTAANAKNIVIEWENWPQEYGDGPFSGKCPLILLTWICSYGPQHAAADRLNNPLPSTESTPST